MRELMEKQSALRQILLLSKPMRSFLRNVPESKVKVRSEYLTCLFWALHPKMSIYLNMQKSSLNIFTQPYWSGDSVLTGLELVKEQSLCQHPWWILNDCRKHSFAEAFIANVIRVVKVSHTFVGDTRVSLGWNYIRFYKLISLSPFSCFFVKANGLIYLAMMPFDLQLLFFVMSNIWNSVAQRPYRCPVS